jgi:hypothetical protein
MADIVLGRRHLGLLGMVQIGIRFSEPELNRKEDYETNTCGLDTCRFGGGYMADQATRLSNT